MDLSTEGMLIIRTLAYALRHNPTQFNLALDAEGWASIEQLVNELRFVRYDWALLEWARIERTISGSDRFEVRNGRIRAAYGHSIQLANPPGVAIPPDMLFHGTNANKVAAILKNGLLPMNRHFVHLASDLDWVRQFVAEKEQWAIFCVNAKVAQAHGVIFRKANHQVWLADGIDAHYLFVDSTGNGLSRMRYANVVPNEAGSDATPNGAITASPSGR